MEAKPLTLERKVAGLFLNIFRVQEKVPRKNPAEVAPISDSNYFGKGQIYELRVKKDDKWLRRRMTVSTLGEETGSKSTCFYVIYERHIVVKIPPKTLAATRFDAYVRSIMAERRIANCFSPRECIVSGVSVITKFFNRVEEEGHDLEAAEDKHIYWLEGNPVYQNLLKIDGAFVYFMDLSRHYTLSDAVSLIHDNLGKRMYEEITGNPEILWIDSGPEGRYGEEHSRIFSELRRLYDGCLKQVRRRREGRVDEYKIKEWFLIHLAGRRITEEKAVRAEFIQKINDLFSTTLRGNQAVQDYRELIRDYVHKVNFHRNIDRIRAIVINLLDLLLWLREKGLSDRDLKPDNILVAGDRSRYPNFLGHDADFHLGLIDVETATVIQPPEGRPIKQPPLGGTPSYLTPTHFFRNDVLLHLFGNLPVVLHFQDFYAVMAIIFEVVTGERLFEQTGKITGQMLSRIKEAAASGQDLAEVAKKVSVNFWKRAQQEFDDKMKTHRERLSAVVVEVFAEAEDMLRGYIDKENKTIGMAIQQLLSNQKIFTSEKNLKYLEKAPLVNMIKLKQKWEKKENIPRVSEKTRLTIIHILNILSLLKKRQEQFKLKVDPLFRPVTGTSDIVISVYELLSIMFALDMRVLYRGGWGVRTKVPAGKIKVKPPGAPEEPRQAVEADDPVRSTKILQEESSMDATEVIQTDGTERAHAPGEPEPDTTRILTENE